MPQPEVSVIVPVFNASRYLAKCLGSLRDQTLKRLEIIAVDDGSTDESPQIIDGFAAADSRFTALHQQNLGVSAARNRGLKQATGKYIGFADADDYVTPEMFEQMVRAADDCGADMAFCGYLRIFSGHIKPKSFGFKDGTVFVGKSREALTRRLIGPIAGERPNPESADFLSSVWNMIYRQELIRKTGAEFVDLQKIGTCEDLLFNLETFHRSRRIVYVDKPLYCYNRANASSITARYRPELLVQWSRLYQMIGNFIESNSLGAAAREALNNRICLSVLNLSFNITCGANASRLPAKYREIRNMLEEKNITRSFENFRISALPVKWRPFYFLAKHCSALMILILAKAVNALRTMRRG